MKMNETWKPVSIGGLTGIVLGAGTMYAVKPGTNGESSEMPARSSYINESASRRVEAAEVAPHVTDDMSFNEAFASARAETGPGGVFCWRGNIYGTYYADEWNAMSDSERDLFASRAKLSVSEMDVNTPATPDVEVAENHVVEVPVETITHEEFTEDIPEVRQVTWNDLASDENDVRIVGYGEVPVDEEYSVTVQELDINGQRVAIVDVNKDGIPDIAMTDLNHNNQMDDGEVIDLETGEALTYTNNENDEVYMDNPNEEMTSSSPDNEAASIDMSLI